MCKKKISELFDYGIKILDERCSDPYLDSKIDVLVLLSEALSVSKEFLFINPNFKPDSVLVEKYLSFLERRVTGEPIAYILNNKEFMSLSFYVSKDCLIPRPETEILTELAIDFCNRNDSSAFLDMCCGSGCISVSVAYYSKKTKIFASDISEKAISVAKINAKKNSVEDRIEFFCGNLFQPLPNDLKFDFIASNPPYISRCDEISSSVANFEPELALYSDDDGLEITEKIIKESVNRLNFNGVLAVEINSSKGSDVKKLFCDNGFSDVSIIKDYNGLDRIVLGACW